MDTLHVSSIILCTLNDLCTNGLLKVKTQALHDAEKIADDNSDNNNNIEDDNDKAVNPLLRSNWYVYRSLFYSIVYLHNVWLS